MARQKEEARIRGLLLEAVTVLCKASLTYESEFCIEGLLGITIDKEDIFLVNIKESVEKEKLQLQKTPVNPIKRHGRKRRSTSTQDSTPASRKKSNKASGKTTAEQDLEDQVQIKAESEEEPDHDDGDSLMNDDDDDRNDADPLQTYMNTSSGDLYNPWDDNPVPVHQLSSDLARQAPRLPKNEESRGEAKELSATKESALPGCSSWQDTQIGNESSESAPDDCHIKVEPEEEEKPDVATNSDIKFVCPYCDQRFSSKSALKDHNRLKHLQQPRHTCPHCSRGFMSRTALEGHIMSHMEIKQQICEKCGAQYRYKKSLQRHMAYKHENVPRIKGLRCQCGKNCPSLAHLQQHSLTCTGQPQFQCAGCGLMFKYKANMVRHAASKHPDLNPIASEENSQVALAEIIPDQKHELTSMEDSPSTANK